MLTRDDIQKINIKRSAIPGRIYTDIDGNTYKGLSNGTLLVYTAPLSNTGVTAGTYGSATDVPQITLDSQGRGELLEN